MVATCIYVPVRAYISKYNLLDLPMYVLGADQQNELECHMVDSREY